MIHINTIEDFAGDPLRVDVDPHEEHIQIKVKDSDSDSVTYWTAGEVEIEDLIEALTDALMELDRSVRLKLVDDDES